MNVSKMGQVGANMITRSAEHTVAECMVHHVGGNDSLRVRSGHGIVQV